MTTVLPQQQVPEIRVAGLSVEADPDRITIREVANTVFELAGHHNIVPLDDTAPPLCGVSGGQPGAAESAVGGRH
ncbi:hypothetical protein [Amycolatopsis taiwanensis]|uniref:Uncharacterized protein n=1 Tax=Amycolatopsis taiwanensis TaxID=342230 RepID=A0A9W6VKJ6_9PSEU|nr:hypothetical protein [Amycolatopsis taiwanensis]GLY70522.1 hypothetical protein Atai01_71410 [Amycolatopsis taiwanensis]